MAKGFPHSSRLLRWTAAGMLTVSLGFGAVTSASAAHVADPNDPYSATDPCTATASPGYFANYGNHYSPATFANYVKNTQDFGSLVSNNNTTAADQTTTADNAVAILSYGGPSAANKFLKFLLTSELAVSVNPALGTTVFRNTAKTYPAGTALATQSLDGLTVNAALHAAFQDRNIVSAQQTSSVDSFVISYIGSGSAETTGGSDCDIYTPDTPPVTPGTDTPELGSGELLATGLLPIAGIFLYRRSRRRRIS